MTDNPKTIEADDDFLRGGPAIAAYLRSLGMKNVSDEDVYYLARAKKIAVGKWGKDLIASKRRLNRDLRRAAQALTT